MKTIFWINVIALTTACAISAPLQRSSVSADAVWVVHLDVDAFKSTVIGHFVLAEMEKPEAQNKLAAFQAIFSFDPRKDVKSLTLYGTGTQPGEGVLIIQGSFDTSRLVTLAKGAKDYTFSKHRDHVIHEWTDERKQQEGLKDARTVAAIAGDRVIFGQTIKAVGTALDVLDKVNANLGSTTHFKELPTDGGSFLQAATRQVEAPEGQPHSAMLRQAKYLSLIAGEASEQINLQLLARTDSEAVAQNMHQIGQGLIALMSLNTNNPAQAAFSKATRLEQSGDQLTATVKLASDDLIQWMKDQVAHKGHE